MREQTFDNYDDQGEYESLRKDCEFRLNILESGYTAREVTAPGAWLYDPQLRCTEPDGCAITSDIGGQRTRTWNTTSGHGALWAIAPPVFGRCAGHMFTIESADATPLG